MTWNNMRQQQSQTADGAFAGKCLVRADGAAGVGDDGLWNAPPRACAWVAPASDAACGVGRPGGQRQAGRQRQARDTLVQLFAKLAALYTGGGAASISRAEAAQLAASLSYQLGLDGLTDGEAVNVLCAAAPDELLRRAQKRLAVRVDAALATWRQVCVIMPPFRNVALRDTLASIGGLRRTYDTYFAAHEVSGQIDYPLQVPVDDTLQGIDYVQAWLDQLLSEARYAASFTFESSVAVLERACPDYRGLHVNLCDLLQAHEGELVRRPAQMAQNGQ